MDRETVVMKLDSVLGGYDTTIFNRCIQIHKPVEMCIQIEGITRIDISGQWVVMLCQDTQVALNRYERAIQIAVCKRGR